jgi:hypothetical protein
MSGEGLHLHHRELDFIDLLAAIIKHQQPSAVILSEVMVGHAENRTLRPDLVILTDKTADVIEVKRESPQTVRRIEAVRQQLLAYREGANHTFRGRLVQVILAIPDSLTAEKNEQLNADGIAVWDRDFIIQRAREAKLEGRARELLSGLRQGDVFEIPESPRSSILDRIISLRPGKTDWSLYQKLCRQAFEHLFCPPLDAPIEESVNESKVNRRDFVIPNYANSGFWQFLRVHYRADYIVVDAKNLAGGVGKNHVLQICNYMTHHGTGLFGVIVTRRGSDRSADQTRREQWILHGKMLLVLNDDDLAQMFNNKVVGEDPAVVIRQKVEDFRLAI